MEAGMMSRGPHLLHSAPPQCLNGPKSNWFIFDTFSCLKKNRQENAQAAPFHFHRVYEYKIDKWVFFFLFLPFLLSQSLLKAWMYTGANDLFWTSITCLHTFQESARTFEIKVPNLNPNKLISFPLIQFSQPLIKAEIQPIKIHVTFLHKILFINIVVQNCRYTSENGPRLFGLYSMDYSHLGLGTNCFIYHYWQQIIR